ncbi:MAG: threonine-phosphate decarboxylase CobD [Zoogloeaceae bacterium]|jgi:cobalamin biosynthetic protein CobC|nr:threonine-phosphate decarboxylase CobD [Zoogloeaceae bacterium]
MPEHGGRLREAARRGGIPLEAWLDLSTGINPLGWPSPRPFPTLPPEVWQRLPEADDGLEAAAAAYYNNPRLLPLPGSQAAIQTLPRLFPPAALACLAPLYAEHPAAWRMAGHKVRQLPAGDLQRALATMTPYVLFCNPNNPTAHHLEREAVLEAAKQLARRGGWLFVDEAFADAWPEHSVSDQAGSEAYPNLVVFRSLGKFFGLAGVRAGFLLGDKNLLAALAAKLGPWPVSHPARWVAARALQDNDWQQDARRRLAADSQRLKTLLTPLAQEKPPAACPLFVTLPLKAPRPLFNFLRERAILTRLFPEAGLLRFGLPPTQAAWGKLAEAVQKTED